MSPAPNPPFFIVGSPRSGTTILRDVLREHPRLASPEETHFYRWPYAFKAPNYTQIVMKNGDLVRHRGIDGISEAEFLACYEAASTRRELQDAYMRLFLEKVGKPQGRWYDKTPQNVYGILLLHADYPEARFVHIHRNPLNVISSLVEGRVMPEQQLDAAINWWTDDMKIMERFRPIAGDRLLEVRYDALMAEPRAGLARIMDFIGEGDAPFEIDVSGLRLEAGRFRDLMSAAQIRLVLARCGGLMTALGYSADESLYLDDAPSGPRE